jgi:hypothetical protein
MGNRICDNIPNWQLTFFSHSTKLSDSICNYLKAKNISKEQLSIFFEIKIEDVEKMLSGCYNFDMIEIAKIELLLTNSYLINKRELIIEKKHHY